MSSADSESAYRNAGFRVAFQGERGAFSEVAALKLLGTGIETVPRETFEELFAAIEDGAADFILAPMENTLAGSVHRCYDLLVERDLRIRAEVIHRIEHYLIGVRGATLAGVKSIESHPVALAQCDKFFSAHPKIRRLAAQDTAGSVRDVIASGDPFRAAIGSKHASELYGGAILAEHLEDDPANFTRFLLLSKADAPQPAVAIQQASWKISLMLQLSHKPGSLCEALGTFAKRGINLLKIESLPIAGRPWEYRFYLDLAASRGDAATRAALEELKKHAASVRELGSYRAAEPSPIE